MSTKGIFKRQEVHNAIHGALRQWNDPSRKGMEFLAKLRTPTKYGFNLKAHNVDCRLALDRMLLAEIDQLRRLQPRLAEVLIRHFKDGETIKEIALSMNLSEEQLNRSQRQGISFIAEFIYYEELNAL